MASHMCVCRRLSTKLRSSCGASISGSFWTLPFPKAVIGGIGGLFCDGTGYLACSPASRRAMSANPSAAAAEDKVKSKKKTAPLRDRRFIDRLFVRVKGGDGGAGCSSFRKSRYSRHGISDGGNGGTGGDVWIEASGSLWDLAGVKKHVNAGSGGNGLPKKMVGRRGEDKVVRVPLGTTVRLIEEHDCGENDKNKKKKKKKKEKENYFSDNVSAITEEQWDVANSSVEDEDDGGEMEESGSPRRHGRGGDDEVQFDHRDNDGVVLRTFPVDVDDATSSDHDPRNAVVDCRAGWEGVPEEESDAEYMCVGGGQAEDGDSDELVTEAVQPRGEEEDGQTLIDKESDGLVMTPEPPPEARESGKADGDRKGVKDWKKGVLIEDLTFPGQKISVATGGRGGRGNASMARGKRRSGADVVDHERGGRGSSSSLMLELKIVADVGLVGLPNAGKSTLLGAMTSAQPRVGSYAFTTLRPHIGSVKFDDCFSFTMADLPGLIEGAHDDRGLGFEFLRHVERTRMLAYVIDLGCGLGENDGPRPWDQLNCVMEELEQFEKGLSQRPALVVASKIDEDGAEEALVELRRRTALPVFPVCAVLGEGVEELRQALRGLVFSDMMQKQESVSDEDNDELLLSDTSCIIEEDDDGDGDGGQSTEGSETEPSCSDSQKFAHSERPWA